MGKWSSCPRAVPIMLSGDLALDSIILCADLTTCITFLVIFRHLRTRVSDGLSFQTLIAVVSLRFLHLCSYQFGLHYRPALLPQVLFLALDVVNCVGGALCLGLFLRHIGTYPCEKDNFGIQLFDKYDCLPKRGPLSWRPVAAASILYAVVAVVAVAWYGLREWHRTRPHPYYLSFYESMSALALVPQLWMFHQDKVVPPLLSNFVVLVAAHKSLVLLFWTAYPSLKGGVAPPNREVQLVFELVNLVILSDFLYYWFRSKLYGYEDVILDLEMIASPSVEPESPR